MEKRTVKIESEAKSIAALQKEMNALKEMMELKARKEIMVATILQTQDKDVLAKLDKAIGKVLKPGVIPSPPHYDEGNVLQGNGLAAGAQIDITEEPLDEEASDDDTTSATEPFPRLDNPTDEQDNG